MSRGFIIALKIIGAVVALFLIASPALYFFSSFVNAVFGAWSPNSPLYISGATSIIELILLVVLVRAKEGSSVLRFFLGIMGIAALAYLAIGISVGYENERRQKYLREELPILIEAERVAQEAAAKKHLEDEEDKLKVGLSQILLTAKTFENAETICGFNGKGQDLTIQKTLKELDDDLMKYWANYDQRTVCHFTYNTNPPTAWVISAPSYIVADKYWCIDSTGSFKLTELKRLDASLPVSCN